jgi:IPT/TIG domain
VAPTGLASVAVAPDGVALCGEQSAAPSRGSGFVNGIKATLGGKSAAITQKDMNTLVLTTPALPAGWQQLVLTNPDGETVSLDAAFLAQ